MKEKTKSKKAMWKRVKEKRVIKKHRSEESYLMNGPYLNASKKKNALKPVAIR